MVIFSSTPFYRPPQMSFATIRFRSETLLTYTLEPYPVTVNSAGLRLTGCPTTGQDELAYLLCLFVCV